MTTKTASLIRQAYLKPELRAPILASLGYRTAISADDGDLAGLLHDVNDIISEKFDGKMEGTHYTMTNSLGKKVPLYVETHFAVHDDVKHGFDITLWHVGGGKYNLELSPKNNFKPVAADLNGVSRNEVLDTVRKKVLEWHTQGSARDLIRAAEKVISSEIDGHITFDKMGGITQSSASFWIRGLSKVWFNLTATTSEGGAKHLRVQPVSLNGLYEKTVGDLDARGSSDAILNELRPMVTVWQDNLSKARSSEAIAPKVVQDITAVAESIKADFEAMMTPKGAQPPVKATLEALGYGNAFHVDDDGRASMYFLLDVERFPLYTSIKKADNALKRVLAKLRPGYNCYYVGNGRREFRVQKLTPIL